MKNYNLLNEDWIPVRRESGQEDWIAPHEVLDSEDPPIAIVAPRADFTGALTEFLVALAQTTFAPLRAGDIKKLIFSPPTAQEWKSQLHPLKPAFELWGDGPAFMQDLARDFGKAKPSEQLLINAPGNNTIKKNKDLFVKHADIVLGPRAAAMAILTRQIYDNGLGGGYRSTLRGAGPITTIILGSTLWETICLNLSTASVWDQDVEAVQAPTANVFPWMAPTQTSEGSKPPVTPEDLEHPFAVFWPMPGRYRLIFVDRDEPVECSVTGELTRRVAVEFEAAQYGNNYEGPFVHPLSPFEVDGEEVSYKRGRDVSGATGTYREWSGFASPFENQHEALTTRQFYEQYRYQWVKQSVSKPRLWCFGYHTAQASAIAWVDFTLNLLVTDGDDEDRIRQRERVSEHAGLFVKASTEAFRTVRGQLRKALFSKPPKVKGGKWKKPSDKKIYKANLGDELKSRFWDATEDGFYRALERISKEDDIVEVHSEWLNTLRAEAYQIFDQVVGVEQLAYTNPKAIAIARNELGKFMSIRSKTFRKILTLPNKKEEVA